MKSKSEFLKKKIEAKRNKFPCSFCNLVLDDLGKLLEHEDSHKHDPLETAEGQIDGNV